MPKVPPLPTSSHCRKSVLLLSLGLLFGTALACVPPRAELVVANGADIEVLDPQIATSSAAGRVFSALFEGLTRLDPETLEVRPGLAQSWQREDLDGNLWAFTLRPNLRWSDGTPLTLEDVAASWRRLADPNTGANYSSWMKDVVVFADLQTATLQVHFPAPQPLFDRMCAFHPLAPIPLALRESTPGSAPKDLPCSGPYQLIERRIRDRIRVAANPNYWRGQAPGFQSIDFLTLDSQFTALNLFLSGDVDYAHNVPDLAVPKLLSDYPQIFHPTPQFTTYFLRFQLRDSPLQDRDLRFAMIHAIDRDACAQSLGGARPAAHSLVPPLVNDYPSVIGPDFDLALARSALQRYRLRNPGPLPRIEYLYPSSDLNRTIAEILQQQWSLHLGLQVSLANQESKTFYPAQRGLDYQISHSSWVGDYLDPLTFLENFHGDSGNNRTGFDNEKYTEMLHWAAVSGDPLLRLELLAEAERLLLREGVVLPLLLDVGQELVSTKLHGFHRNATSVIDWAALYPAVNKPPSTADGVRR